MDNMNKPREGQLQIELTPQTAQGSYANLAILTHSHSEFILDFASVLPGLQKAPVVSRIVMNPEHAKRLLVALQDNVAKYEKQFGTIVLPGQQVAGQGRTATPFGVAEGN